MKYIYYLTFVTLVIVIGWIFRPVEHMTSETCKRRIYGPEGVEYSKNSRVFPEIYGPSSSGFNPNKKKPGSNPKLNRPGSDSTEDDAGGSSDSLGDTPDSTTSMYEDDGEFRSDTATRNAAYMNVFTFKPYAKMDFPTSGPPQPYLSDFASFHR